MEKTLNNGLRVAFKSIGEAGMIDLEKVQSFSSKLVLEISGGQPYKFAYEQAEMLAITIDAEFVVDSKVIRYSINGDYFIKENKNV